MKRFDSGDLYQPAAQSQGFNPIQAPDITPLLRENNDARMQEARMFADERLADLELEEHALKYTELLENEGVESLATFSQSLSTALIEQAKLQNKREEERGLMLAYTNGIHPDVSAAFDADEAALKDGASAINKAANQFYREGMPVDMVKGVENLSGWAKYGYYRGLAEQGANNYGAFYTDAAQKLRVMVPGRAEPITLMEATSSAERAAVKTAIAERYVSQFVGMNPALLNKYLFPEMKKWERRDDLEFASKQRDAYNDMKESEFKDSIFSAHLDVDSFGSKFLESLNFYNATFGNRSVTNTKGFEYARALASKGVLTNDHIDSLEQATLIRSDTGKEDFASNVFKRQIAELRFAVAEGESQKLRDKKNAQLVSQDKFKEDYLRARESEGGEGEFDEKFSNKWGEAWKSQFPFTPVPDWISKDISKQDKSILDERAIYEARIEGEKHLTDQDFMNMHPDNRRYFTQQGIRPIPSRFALEPGGKYYNKARKELEDHARTFFKLTEGEPNNISTFRFTERAMLAYERAYNDAVTDIADPFRAHQKALADTIEMASIIDEKSNPFAVNEELTLSSQKKAMHEAETTRFYLKRHGNFEEKIPNLESAIDQLKRWKDTGKGGLPSVFLAATSGLPDVDPWELAEAQYKAYTGEELVRPQLESKVQQLTPETRRLLQKYNTPSRTLRAVVASGGFNELAKLTGYYESKGFGDYDAMNTAGYGQGINNRAEGSADSKDVFDKGLSQMTVAEVLDLQKRGLVFAAGRYQFIPKTLKWVIEREDLPTDVLFDKNFQDWIWASQVRYRLENHGSDYVYGLRSEWLGLHHAPTYKIKAAVGSFRESKFNNPQYLHPGLVTTSGADK